MSVEWVRSHCLSFHGATEHLRWGNHLVFKAGGKMFAVAALEPDGHFLSFKTDPERFSDLIEQPGIVPAPYLARAKWVALAQEDVLTRAEIRSLLKISYELVVSRLPKKVQRSLQEL